MELHLVPHADVLPVGDDAIRAVDVAAHQVLEEVVAVEPTPPLPQLGDPRPDLIGGGANGDGASRGEVGVRDEVIAGEALVELLLGRSPPEIPGPGQKDVAGDHANGGCPHGVPASHPR
jgi:hypothetical protein